MKPGKTLIQVSKWMLIWMVSHNIPNPPDLLSVVWQFTVKKTDPSVVDDEFEIKLWTLKLKTSFAVVPSHLSFNHVRFKEHFETILSQLSRENKNIFLMGEFNINLLNCESHPESNNFLLILNSYFLLPYSLQPTHITIRSTTLINNIDCQWFESYAEYW